MLIARMFNDIPTNTNLGAILNLTPHRSAELLFEQKEERSAYIADNQLYINGKKHCSSEE